MVFFVVYSSVYNVFWHHNIEYYLNYTIKKKVSEAAKSWRYDQLKMKPKSLTSGCSTWASNADEKNSLLPPCSKCRSCSQLWFSSLFKTNSEWSKKMALRFFFKCSLEYKEMENCKISWWTEHCAYLWNVNTLINW